MTRTSLAGTGLMVLTLASGLSPVPARAISTNAWDTGSTALVLGLGALAAGTTVAKSDGVGGKQLVFGLGATLLAAEALQAVVHERRPDKSNNHSFPSGHTALAFAAATYFDVRYGQDYPQYVPFAYGAAVLTGIARVQAKKHYAQDVVVGAAIGWVLADTLTTAHNTQLTVSPAPGGAAVTYTQRF
jgi:membrane-associated phospholipid phosphatase